MVTKLDWLLNLDFHLLLTTFVCVYMMEIWGKSTNNGKGKTIMNFRIFRYYVEVSLDQKKWKKVIDYSEIACRSYQHLYFGKEIVQYVKVVGTYSSLNEVWALIIIDYIHLCLLIVYRHFIWYSSKPIIRKTYQELSMESSVPPQTLLLRKKKQLSLKG